jgi:hypothetical protein
MNTQFFRRSINSFSRSVGAAAGRCGGGIGTDPGLKGRSNNECGAWGENLPMPTPSEDCWTMLLVSIVAPRGGTISMDCPSSSAARKTPAQATQMMPARPRRQTSKMEGLKLILAKHTRNKYPVKTNLPQVILQSLKPAVPFRGISRACSACNFFNSMHFVWPRLRMAPLRQQSNNWKSLNYGYSIT